ncbi:hypothetical protein N9921_00840 [Akkermansiaceae bacterium]|nr:hypothetical protein [Akkermansiaceae bacterium]
MPRLTPTTRRLLAASLFASGGLLHAQDSIVTREVAERAEAGQDAYQLLKDGDQAYKKGDFGTAAERYRSALSQLPRQGSEMAVIRASAVERFSQAAVQQARVLSRTGDYEAANDLLDEVDAEDVDPGNAAADLVRNQIADPIRTNPALTKEHSANVDQVRRLLYTAEGHLDAGKFDRAQMTYEDVLRIDPYNKASRRGIERVDWYRSDYAAAAYDHTRAKMLQKVDAIWEDQTYLELPSISTLNGDIDGRNVVVSAPLLKLRSIMIPIVDMQDTTLTEALEFLHAASVEHDTTTFDETKKGVDFITQLGSSDHPDVQQILASRISLRLENVPLMEALKYVTEATRTQYKVDEFAVIVRPIGSNDETLIRREFRVPPDFLSRDSINSQGDNEDVFADNDGADAPLLQRRLSAIEKLKALGVRFPDGATARFNSNSSTLVVFNTISNLDFVSQIVSAAAETEPVAVVIRTSIIEISQENLEELGYDTILNEMSLGGSDRLFLNGGSVGNGSSLGDQLNGNPVTSGNRSGNEAVIVDGLDALLTRTPSQTPTGRVTIGSAGIQNNSSLIIPPPGGANTARAPGAIAVRGIVDNSLQEIMLRGFSQKKGVDLMTQPSVVTRSGQNAVIKSVQDFLYPDEYEPPELPNDFGTTSITDAATGESVSLGGNTVVTPATPTSFLKTELGVILEVTPTVSADRRYIEVSVRPRIRDFLGFVNFGSPITGANSSVSLNLGGIGNAGADTFTTTADVGEITPNAILKPLIRNIEANTTVTVMDGSTIVIGGQMRETVQRFEDGTPILKDLPLVGRYFRSEGLSTIKTNLIIMVQVELQDPAGNLYRNR